MVSVSEAKRIIDEATVCKAVLKPLSAELVGLVLSGDLVARCDVPPFDNSAMDGYAVRYQPDTKTYRVAYKIRAGETFIGQLGFGEAARIYTGAPVPPGADTVVQQELAALQGDLIHVVPGSVRHGMNVRLCGAQCKAGETIATSGSILTPGLVALAASVGITKIPVYQPPTIGIIVTGDELIAPGSPLTPGKIYNSNGLALQSYCKFLSTNAQQIVHLVDDPEVIRQQIAAYLESYDLLLLSGGISVGDYDYIREGLQQEGVAQLFYKVKQKPGKPLFFGTKGDTIVFGLPGNPAAALTCFNQYVKPCIRKKLGYSAVWQPNAVLPVENTYHKPSGATHFLKAQNNQHSVLILERQQSFDLFSFNQSDCFVEVPEAISVVEAGSTLPVYSW